MPGQTFEAMLTVTITRTRGPELPEDHVMMWLVADGMPTTGAYNGFSFEACVEHADPSECEHDVFDAAFDVMIGSVEGVPE